MLLTTEFACFSSCDKNSRNCEGLGDQSGLKMIGRIATSSAGVYYIV